MKDGEKFVQESERAVQATINKLHAQLAKCGGARPSGTDVED